MKKIVLISLFAFLLAFAVLPVHTTSASSLPPCTTTSCPACNPLSASPVRCVLTLTMADKGKTFMVTQGTLIIVELPTLSGSHLVYNPNILTPAPIMFLPPVGEQAWALNAVGIGTTPLYRIVGQTGPTDWAVTITVLPLV